MRCNLCLVLLLALFPIVACAAEEPKISVTAIGTVKALASDLTLSISLAEKGEDAAVAIANISAVREKVMSKLAEFGGKVDMEQIELPAIVEANPNAQRQRYRAVGRLKKAADPSKPVKTEVSMRQALVAHIPFKGKDAAALLLEAEALKAKLRPEITKIVKTEAPPEEADDEEEMQQNFGENPAGAPAVNFWYSAKRGESLEDKAVAEALAKAKAGASRTAKAMGEKTAVVHSVTVHPSSRGGRQWDENYGQWREASVADTAEPVLYSDTPTVSLTSTLTVVFRLQ